MPSLKFLHPKLGRRGRGWAGPRNFWRSRLACQSVRSYAPSRVRPNHTKKPLHV